MHWSQHAPPLFTVVTGYFPEILPDKDRGQKLRPLLVCGSRYDPVLGHINLRIAYGTKNMHRATTNDVIVANISDMDALGLRNPTLFVISSGAEMALIPWTAKHFHPWTGRTSPVLGLLPSNQQTHAHWYLGQATDLPQF